MTIATITLALLLIATIVVAITLFIRLRYANQDILMFETAFCMLENENSKLERNLQSSNSCLEMLLNSGSALDAHLPREQARRLFIA